MLFAAALLMGAPSAHAQAAAEYSGAMGVSASAAASKPELFRPGAVRNSSRFLEKPSGPPPGSVNREWFAKQAGKKGARLSIDASMAQTSVWIDGKFVGKAPVTVTLPAGKHHVSLQGPRQEHAGQEVDITSGKNQHLTVHLRETYPSAVSIRVFGGSQP